MPARADGQEISEAAARVGRTLRDKWHLDALIDQGGMAAVYAATHRNGMRGAVKILHKHRASDPDIVARFRREGYIANKVAHPNAVSVLDDDVDDDGSMFLVMELLDGSTLRERAAAHGGVLPADEVLLAADQLLDVLAASHDLSIVHRDVKPDNVFITSDGRLKILDFGIARLAESTAPPTQSHSQTMAGLPMGSPAYMSPEQARGRWDLVGPQSDVWSVGATMFTLLSGQDVHTRETVAELLAAIFNTPAPSLATRMPDAHPALVEVVDRALALRLADRWPDARAMQAAVRAAYEAIFSAPPPPLPERMRPAAVSVLQELAEARAAEVGATTVTAPIEARSAARSDTRTAARRYVRPGAVAVVFVVAGALRIAAGDDATRAGERAVATASLAEIVLPLPSALVGDARSLAVGPRSAAAELPAPPASSAPPAAPRVRRPSVFDRRH